MENTHVCPWQRGAWLTGFLRKLAHNPRTILAPYVAEGMSAVDMGSGMGFFTLPMSRMVGDGGQVIAIDLQPEMLEGLKQQALRDNCRNIVPHVCGAESLHAGPWKESVNFALLFWMLHEVPDAERLLREIYDLLVPGGRLLFAEPLGHVGNGGFQKSVAAFQQCGFTVVESPKIALSRARVFQKH